MRHFIDWWLIWRAQSTVGRVFSMKAVTGYRRKQDEQATRSKSVSSVSLWCLIQFLPTSSVLIWCISNGLSPESIRWNKPFPPYSALGHAIFHINRKLPRIVTASCILSGNHFVLFFPLCVLSNDFFNLFCFICSLWSCLAVFLFLSSVLEVAFHRFGGGHTGFVLCNELFLSVWQIVLI